MLAEQQRHTPAPRGLQLALRLEGVSLAPAHPLRRRDSVLGRVQGDQLPAWMRARLPKPPAADGPRICPAEIPGQLLLLRARRSFTLGQAQLIKDRAVPDYDLAREAARELRAEGGMSYPWFRVTVCMARLALAARDPGERLVREEDLDDIPEQRLAVGQALGRAGLLRPRAPSLPPPTPRPRSPVHVASLARVRPDRRRSCETCLAWSGTRQPHCRLCRAWVERWPAGPCRRCQRQLPLQHQLCRFCSIILAHCERGRPPVDQLWFGGPFALPLRDHRLTSRAGSGRRPGRRDPDPYPPRVSDHLVDPAQSSLFEDLRRDWSRLDLSAGPALTAAAERLLDELDRHARAESWTPKARADSLRLLHVPLAWLGAAAPVAETDLRAVAALQPTFTAPVWCSS